MREQPPTTDWTAISQAKGLPDAHAVRRDCLSALAEKYHEPVRAMMRAWGLRDEHDLDDAVQTFFLDFLEKNWLDMLARGKGRFRGFLRTSINHFLINRKRRARPPMASLPDDDLVPSGEPTPEQTFDRTWARQIVDRALADFRTECAERDLPHYWTAFERHVLDESCLSPTVRETAELLGVAPKDAANYLYRARTRFAELVREAVGRTVNGPAGDIRDEMECLRRSL